MAKLRLADMAIHGCVLLLYFTGWIHQTRGLHIIPGYEDEQACYGTSAGFANNGNPAYRYEKYKDNYSNCTYVVGNLEIVFLDEVTGDMDYDMSFLSQIREVTGYVLLAANYASYVNLTSLQIIRGLTLFHHKQTNENFSLFVALNYDHTSRRGLQELRFTSLREILAGKVFFQNNDYLCFENTIYWQDINPYTTPPVIFKSDSNNPKRSCGECHESCYNSVTKTRHCWGEGPDMCQRLSHGVVCHENCGDSRCYGSLPNQCCHPECAVGCTGPRKTDCMACRNFKDGANCVAFCPRQIIYDKNLMMNIKNPNAKYAFGSVCVESCPGFLLQDDGHCVRQCRQGSFAKDQTNCEPCNGPCPRPCKGVEEPDFVNLDNIKDFEGCTTIDGNLRILSSSFLRDPHYDIEPLHPSNLTVLKHVKEITGYLLIQSNHSEFTDLSFLSSLEVIHGRTIQGTKGNALDIMSTPLKSLELISLRRISFGNVFIFHNINLCYADTIDWKELMDTPSQKSKVYFNKDPDECAREKEVCDGQCDTTGCWGKGQDKCLKCANYVFEEEGLCLSKCTDMPRLYHKSDGKCMKCHPECANTCTGPENTDCDKCANVIMRNKQKQDSCEPECGDTMYPDDNMICQACHPFCNGNGCTGPSEVYGADGCNGCDMGIQMNQISPIQCMPPGTDSCDDGYHRAMTPNVNSSSFPVCEKCHELCVTCTGPGPQFCKECKFFRSDLFCVEVCPNLFFGNEETKTCDECDKECRGGCDGPLTSDCYACANFKIYTNLENNTFNCTPECPPHLRFLVKEREKDENLIVCADSSHPEVKAIQAKNAEEEKQKLTIILAVAVPVALIVIFVIIGITYFCHKRAQNNRKAAEYTAKIAGVDEMEPLTPTNAKPDLAQMRIISEEELRKGAIIGSGAFGTVYKGIWIPQGENVKIPVAIKVLQEGTSPNQSTELLEEARVMCSVEHLCCVRILAVCMKSQMMLVTQLMPHGNLLNYVRANSQHIGSKALLNWCTQIARGMAYLEERGIVHRDLAARNVLVQTPNQVKITDFGLAKLLDSDSLEYHSSGGLMPIKWLALECILNRIFTHKSDVWSFGITVWELFTLGKKPYENVRTKDVPLLLEKGERLQQPIICTIDVYMIMVKCWMLDAESRPSFKELVEEFAKMSRDPGRYLVIEGDEYRRFPDSAFIGDELDLSPMDEVDLQPGPSTSRAATSCGGATARRKGDNLMRLPSVSYDKNDLVHGIVGGPESVMEAEEYLQPVDDHRLHRPSSMPHSPDRQLSNISTGSGHLGEDPLVMSGGAKGGKGALKVREKKYGHLNAAARAKQEREQPHQRGDSVSSRYSSDPIKYSKDKEEVDFPPGMDAMFNGGHPQYPYDPRSPKAPMSMRLPVDKDDYLQPGAAAQSLAYLDLDGKGYYKNEKEAQAAHDDIFLENETDQMLNYSTSSTAPLHNGRGNSHPYHPYFNQEERAPPATGVAVSNPDYFDDDNNVNVWEPKKPMRNGYHPLPNTSLSPIHSNKDAFPSYYQSMNGDTSSSPNSSPLVNTKVTLHGTRLDSTESKV